ncbi:MAG: DUF1501 domain-containing protein [Planctomycetia bacterium]|nr:DUF1501 domain-containing protein [Planctomycetia bacterium]
MNHGPASVPEHPRLGRRAAIQAGAIGLLGLGMNHLAALRALGARAAGANIPGAQPADTATPRATPKAARVIYIFLSGGLSQQESFDLKPDAPDGIRGEFRPIATRTPGIHISEHLPELAKRSHLWALVRSLTHPSNDHSVGHMMMLTGRSAIPQGFDSAKPKPSDWPSIAAVAGAATPRRDNLPPAVVLPEQLIHRTGRVIPGQFGGLMGVQRDPWFVEACRFNANSYGAWPRYGFHFERGGENPQGYVFQAPNLALPEGLAGDRFQRRLQLLEQVGCQQEGLERLATNEKFDRYRQDAISLLADPRVYRAFDVTNAEPDVQDRYGRNVFGWSLLMAKRLVTSGVNLVQVNLGNNETWDTHQSMFPILKDYLFPPTDRALSALLDDLEAEGLLDSTLIVMAGEFGRTPKISTLPGAKQPGRDHWGAVQTVFFAGGGVHGGTVIGSSDRSGGHPATAPQKPDNMAATIYQALGIPATAAWHDEVDRPHQIYSGDPIPGLT